MTEPPPFKFGLFYIPPQASDFYRLGSEILGYDVRTERVLEWSPELRQTLGSFDPTWVGRAQPFGFHLSVSDGLETDPALLPDVEREIAGILGCFDPRSTFELRLVDVRRWADDRVFVLLCEANENLKILQAVLMARVALLARNSAFFEKVRQSPDRYAAPYERRRLDMFLTPRGLDTWQPHFTLLNPYSGRHPERLELGLRETFVDTSVIRVASFCLAVQESGGLWRVHQEYRVLTTSVE